MTEKQISIFLENKSGTLLKVFELLKEEGIQLTAVATSDTADYGILRIICNDPDKAYGVLKEKGLAVSVSDVFVARLEDRPGSGAELIGIFAAEGVNINYLYSSHIDGHAVLIFKTNDFETACRIIAEKGYQTGLK